MDKRYTRSWWAVVLFLVVFLSTSTIRRCGKNTYRYDEGLIFGTFYHITYKYPESLSEEIKNRLLQFDASLSPFNDTSIISRVNRNEPVETDRWFEHVFNASRRIYTRTGGTFDPTVSPLVNAWGFGFNKSQDVNETAIDSMRRFVGFNKVRIDASGRVVKSDPRVMLDCSAIAKGFGCDEVARLFDNKGIKNYMIEIGGEIVVRGNGPGHKEWNIGISKPVEDSLSADNGIQAMLRLTDCAIATSGNYRRFYYKDGRRYSHTVDPRTGYPVNHTLLSSTVVADDCATADAYATAFMVLGLDSARTVLRSNPRLKAMFIYSNAKGENEIWISPELKSKMKSPGK